MNVYYSNAIGRAQWTDFSSPTNIYLMPSSFFVSVNRWIKNGMKTNGIWWVRIVLLEIVRSPFLTKSVTAKRHVGSQLWKGKKIHWSYANLSS